MKSPKNWCNATNFFMKQKSKAFSFFQKIVVRYPIGISIQEFLDRLDFLYKKSNIQKIENKNI